MSSVALHRKKNRECVKMDDRWKKFFKIILVIAILYVIYVVVNINIANKSISNNIGISSDDISKDNEAGRD